jgi:hypothetical protein
MPCFLEDTYDDIKGELRSRKLKNTIIQWQTKTTKEQTMMYKTPNRTPIALKLGVNLDFPEG